MTDTTETTNASESRIDASTHAPPTAGSVRTERATWRVPTRFSEGGCRRIALCRYTPAGLALQHVRTVRVRQRGPASTVAIDATATPAELPDHVRRDLEHRSDEPLVTAPDPLEVAE